MRETRAPVLDPGGGRPGPDACGRDRAMTANAHTAVTSETKRGGAMAPLRLHMTLPVWETIPVKGLLPLPYMSERLIADSSRTSVPRESGSALKRPTH